MSDKPSLRKSLIMHREALSAETRNELSAAITSRVTGLPEYLNATTVLGYMNIGAEYSSELWVAQALADGKRLILPRVNHHSNLLDLYWVEDPDTQLAHGLWGIREPIVQRCKRLEALNEVEFALLPGVAFTRDGARLGYGGGYYDKLLAEKGKGLNPVLVAGAFSMQLVEHIPLEDTDVKMNWIITEQEAIACS